MITREEFRSNVDENAVKIIEFLAKNIDKAFTDKEISDKLKIDLRTTFLTLVDLKMAGAIVGKTVKGMYHYSVTDNVASKIQTGELDITEMLHPRLHHDSEEDSLRYIG